jgi:signal transduction histidine kinase
MRASFAPNGSNAATLARPTQTVRGRVDTRGVKIRPISRRGVALAATVLTLGLGTGTAAAGGLAAAAGDASSAALQLRTASVRNALDTTFQRYADTMHDLVAAAATQPTASLAPTVTRIAGARLPGAHQILVAGPDGTVRAQHTADGSTPPARTTLTAEPELARGLDLARQTGRLTASPAHVLPADLGLPPAHRQPGFQLIAPVHDDVFLGWVVVAVRAPDLLRESLRGITGVATVLTETSPDGVTHEVARWAEGGAPTGDETGIVEVAPAGHTWQVEVRPTTALVGAARTVAAPLTLLGAVLISLLFAVVLLGSDRARLRAETRGRQAAADADTARQHATDLTGFATAAADHLHAPLHTIAGFTEMLLEDAQLDPDARKFLTRISGSTARMLSLVDDLLVYSTAGDATLELEPVDAGGLALGVVAGCLDDLEGERPSIDVGDLPAVTADADLLGEVLAQLVGNAVRFVRHGTAARVTLGARDHAPGWVRIEVADRGIGVPEDQRERIFAPFHRAPAAEGFPGTGLGLAVCRRIVTLHGGEIGVEANPGGGSIFWFTLPASPVAAPTGPELLAADLA